MELEEKGIRRHNKIHVFCMLERSCERIEIYVGVLSKNAGQAKYPNEMICNVLK